MIDLKKMKELAEESKKTYGSNGAVLVDATAQLALIDQLEAAQKDAARYQWLRDKSGAESAIENYWGGDGTFVVYLNDESIDAAMASQS